MARRPGRGRLLDRLDTHGPILLVGLVTILVTALATAVVAGTTDLPPSAIGVPAMLLGILAIGLAVFLAVPRRIPARVRAKTQARISTKTRQR